jgi:sporulation protein YlmC with PRC-barrel domain
MEFTMNRLPSRAAASATLLMGPGVLSYGARKTISMMKVAPQFPTKGYPISKMVGRIVVNEANEKLGTIEDLILAPGEKVPFAVLSIRGFLGIRKKYVVVPYRPIPISDKKMMLPGATKAMLKSLPEFEYNF